MSELKMPFRYRTNIEANYQNTFSVIGGAFLIGTFSYFVFGNSMVAAIITNVAVGLVTMNWLLLDWNA